MSWSSSGTRECLAISCRQVRASGPVLLKRVTHVLAYLVGHVYAEAVHSGQGMATAIHVGDLAQLAGLQPGDVGVPV
jgi:hypothetical protein